MTWAPPDNHSAAPLPGRGRVPMMVDPDAAVGAVWADPDPRNWDTAKVMKECDDVVCQAPCKQTRHAVTECQ